MAIEQFNINPKLFKTGDSFAIRIPIWIVKALDKQEGDELDIRIMAGDTDDSNNDGQVY